MKNWKNWLAAAFGGIVYALAVEFFYLPSGITTGGITGLSIILHRLFNTPVGMVALAMNVPLFLLGFWKLGMRFGVASLYGTAVSYVATDLIALLPLQNMTRVVEEDPLLGCLFGGLLMGAGLGIVFAAGATTGGTDIPAALISRKYPHITMGRVTLFCDLIVITCGTVTSGEVRSFLYGCVALFLSSRAIDAVLYGLERGNAAFIITSHPERVKEAVFSGIYRGVTELSARGGYTGEGKTVLLCAVSRTQGANIQRLVYAADPEAFVILTEAGAVYGNGFGDRRTGS